MPNAQRKQQYLAIYGDITKQNETLISLLIQLSNKRKTEEDEATRGDGEKIEISRAELETLYARIGEVLGERNTARYWKKRKSVRKILI